MNWYRCILVGIFSCFLLCAHPATQYDGRSFLVSACARGDMEIVCQLLNKAKDQSDFKRVLNDTFFAAIWGNQKKLITYLEKLGCNFVDMRDDHSLSALHWAAYSGHKNLVVEALERGCDIELRSGSGRTALHYAAEQGQSDIVRFLVEEGNANTNVINDDGWTPLQEAATERQFGVVVYLLRETNLNLENLPDNWLKFLSYLVCVGHFGIYTYLVNRCKLADPSGDTIFHYCVRSNQPDCYTYLATLGFNPFQLNNTGLSPAAYLDIPTKDFLFFVSDKAIVLSLQSLKICELEKELMKLFVIINGINPLAELLFRAIKCDAPDLVRSILKVMPALNNYTSRCVSRGHKPLAFALSLENEEIIQILKAAGAR